MTTEFIGSGWSYPLEITASGAFALSGGLRNLEQAMRIILTTSPGERPMRPEFGCRLREHLFRGTTIDNRAAVGVAVRSALAHWEPRVTVENVHVYPDDANESLLHVDIEYVVKATNDRHNLVFPFYTIPQEEED